MYMLQNVVTCCFFYWCVDHRVRHVMTLSFPTPGSSELVAGGLPRGGFPWRSGGGYSRRLMSTLEMRSGNTEKAQDSGLLAPDEPRPFELFNGAGQAPLLLLCDHATRFVPRALGRLDRKSTRLNSSH